MCVILLFDGPIGVRQHIRLVRDGSIAGLNDQQKGLLGTPCASTDMFFENMGYTEVLVELLLHCRLEGG